MTYFRYMKLRFEEMRPQAQDALAHWLMNYTELTEWGDALSVAGAILTEAQRLHEKMVYPDDPSRHYSVNRNKAA